MPRGVPARRRALLPLLLAASACGLQRVDHASEREVSPQTELQPPGVTQREAVELNPGWIGGACGSFADCTSPRYSQEARCDRDFPGGQCVQACSRATSGAFVCPDEDLSPGSPFSTTRCIADANAEPRCVSACDFERSPTGCRPGYSCVLKPRFGSEAVFPVCLPADREAWPGAPAPGNDMAGECYIDGDCEHFACLKVSGGYCSKLYCEHSGCPEGSVCARLNEDGLTGCLRTCDRDAQCRTDAAHQCTDSGVCFPRRTPPPHDPSVAARDCAEAWGQAGERLHRCDHSPDRYLVVNKSARNLAFCERGIPLESFPAALGFTPWGDKVREGDGRTPEGVFYVAQRKPTSQFYRAYLLSYPNEEDAARGLDDALISAAEATAIRDSIDRCAVPPQTTLLGSLIEVHGHNEPGGPDWTWGCVAISDPQIDRLWPHLQVGDTIVVRP